MRHTAQRSLDQTGLNLIRIVIGSYFMAISLGLIKGISPPVLFLSVAGPQLADLIGTIILFAVTTCFMVGICLRLTSLMLAIFVMASSVAQNFVMPSQPMIEPFWRDLTLVCAVLLAYSSLKRSDIRSAALVRRRTAPKLSKTEPVAPRRVNAPSSGVRRSGQADYVNTLKPLIQKHSPASAAPCDIIKVEPPVMKVASKPRALAKPMTPQVDDEIENIFAVI